MYLEVGGSVLAELVRTEIFILVWHNPGVIHSVLSHALWGGVSVDTVLTDVLTGQVIESTC